MRGVCLWFFIGSVALVNATLVTNIPPRLAVAWNDSTNRSGYVQGMDINPPWNLNTSPIEVGRDALLRYARGNLYVIRPSQDLISVVDPRTWTITRTYTLPPGTEPEDIAVVGADMAYVAVERRICSA